MPIDPRIPLGVQAPQIQNPLEVMSTVAQLQAMREQTEARRLAAEEAREKAKDAAAVRQILAETGGDMEKALPRLRQIAPKAALDFEQTLAQTQKEKFAAATNQMTARSKELEFAASMAALVADNPALAPVVRERLQRISADITPLLPTSDDPADWGKFSSVTLTAKERYERSQANLKLFGEGKLQEALGRGLSTATSGEEWDKTIQGFRDIGGPQQIADLFGGKGAFSPENVARAAQLAQPPAKPGAAANLQAKEVLLDGRPALATFNPDTGTFNIGGQDVTARVRPIPPPNPLQLVSVLGEGGQPVLVPESQAVGKVPGSAAPGARPATEGERKAAGFHSQMQQAITTINALEGKLSERDIYQIQSLPQEGVSGAINRSAMSENAKRYIQAFNQFTEARLRPVSGAAIADSEYARDRATYGKQYSETPDLAAQREAARTQALESLRVMGGSAIEAPSAPKTFTVTAPNGKTYTFPSAAEAAAFKRRAGID